MSKSKTVKISSVGICSRYFFVKMTGLCYGHLTSSFAVRERDVGVTRGQSVTETINKNYETQTFCHRFVDLHNK